MKNDGKSGLSIWGAKRKVPVTHRETQPQHDYDNRESSLHNFHNRNLEMNVNNSGGYGNPSNNIPYKNEPQNLMPTNYVDTNQQIQTNIPNQIGFSKIISHKKNINQPSNINPIQPKRPIVGNQSIKRNDDFYFNRAFQDKSVPKNIFEDTNIKQNKFSQNKKFEKEQIEKSEINSNFIPYTKNIEKRKESKEYDTRQNPRRYQQVIKEPILKDYENMGYMDSEHQHVEYNQERNQNFYPPSYNRKDRKLNIKLKEKEDNVENYDNDENFEDFPQSKKEEINRPKKKVKLGKKPEESKPIHPDKNITTESKQSSMPKPKIDLSMVNKLENKRKEFINNLKTQERERSSSPVSINMVTTSKTEEPPRKIVSKERTINSFIPQNLNYDSKINEKAKLNSMCNSKEMKEREEQNRLSVFESDPFASFYDEHQKRNILRVNPEYAVKIFSRPAADTIMDDPENLRPPEVLTKTINFLLNEIVDIDNKKEKQKNIFMPIGDEINFENIAKYIEDRFRSIKQDFTILDLKGNKNCIEGHEKIARFLILCLNETLDFDAFAGQQSLFKLFIKQLNATLTSLREFYEYVNANKEVNKDVYVSPFQAEFYSYSILLSIKETFDLVSMINIMPDYIKTSDQIKLTLKIVRAIMGKEWLTFFQLLKSRECNYLLACVMSLYFKEMRTEAMTEISKSFGIKIKDSFYKTSLNMLNKIFIFEDYDECISFLEWFGCDTNYIYKDDPDAQFELVIVKLIGEEANLPRKTNHFIESKKGGMDRKDIIKYFYFIFYF